jgi:hypothetical protein
MKSLFIAFSVALAVAAPAFAGSTTQTTPPVQTPAANGGTTNNCPMMQGKSTGMMQGGTMMQGNATSGGMMQGNQSMPMHNSMAANCPMMGGQPQSTPGSSSPSKQ